MVKMHRLLNSLRLLLNVIFRLTYRYVFGSIWGVLGLTLLLYFNSEFVLGTQPITFKELALLVISMESSTKASIATALITIIGFMVAYWTASSNWKEQLRAQLCTQASGRLTEFSNLCSQDITTCKIYAENVVKVYDLVERDELEQAFHLVNYIHSSTQKTLLAREQVIANSIKSHILLSPYNSILVGIPGSIKHFQLACKRLGDITDFIYFPISYPIQDDKNVVDSFLRCTNKEKCTDYIRLVNKNFDSFNMNASYSSGCILRPISGINLWSAFSVLSNMRLILNVLVEERKINKE